LSAVLKTYLLRSVVWAHPRDEQGDYELRDAREPRGHRHDERHVLAGDLNHNFATISSLSSFAHTHQLGGFDRAHDIDTHKRDGSSVENPRQEG